MSESTRMSSPIIINVTSKLVHLVRLMAENYSHSTGADPDEFYVEYYLDLQPHLSVLYPVGQALGITSGHTVVEIGSGMGTRCLLGNAVWGANFIGVEPCVNTYKPLREAIREFLASNTAYCYRAFDAPGENTGLADGCADILLSFEVMEHVQDPEKVVMEMHRLLKPGGKLFVSTCSYSSFYEGHYRCFWLPFLNRHTGRAWARCMSCNPDFLKEVNFITRRKLVDYLRKAGFEQMHLGYRYGRPAPPPLAVAYPDGFELKHRSRRKSFWQEFIQRKKVHDLLAHVGMEYKVYLEATKAG